MIWGKDLGNISNSLVRHDNITSVPWVILLTYTINSIEFAWLFYITTENRNSNRDKRENMFITKDEFRITILLQEHFMQFRNVLYFNQYYMFPYTKLTE